MQPMRRLAPLLPVALALAVPSRSFAHGSPAPPPSFPGVVLEWRLEPIVLVGLAAAAIAWVTLARRVAARHPGHPHPAWRSAAFLGGLAALAHPFGVIWLACAIGYIAFAELLPWRFQWVAPLVAAAVTPAPAVLKKFRRSSPPGSCSLLIVSSPLVRTKP